MIQPNFHLRQSKGKRTLTLWQRGGIVVFVLGFVLLYPVITQRIALAKSVTPEEKTLTEAVLNSILDEKINGYYSRNFAFVRLDINKKIVIIDKKRQIVKIEQSKRADESYYTYYIYRNYALAEVTTLEKNETQQFRGCSMWGLFENKNKKWQKLFLGGGCDMRSHRQQLLQDTEIDVNRIPVDVQKKFSLDK